MKTEDLQQIRNFYRIGHNIATAGQPTIEEFTIVKQNNFDLIINLAKKDSPNAISNESSIVAGLGLNYIHIPVDFKAPALSDLQQFFEIMERHRNKHIFVHCALNRRVSSFMFLYRIIKCNLSVLEALRDLHAVWQPDNIWQSFIDTALTHYNVND
jgi:protein tyrosine phosphatase (PTP) superfamily phosphohydrolase (DUF442 family)